MIATGEELQLPISLGWALCYVIAACEAVGDLGDVDRAGRAQRSPHGTPRCRRGSREALRGTAERLYAQLVVAANNREAPPSWTPRRFARYLRWAWLVEGGAQYFSRQVGFYRPAVIRRLRESARPSFPPSRRDAVILGGTIFDLLEMERGSDACERLALHLLPGGAVPTIEAAFEASIGEIRAPGATTCAKSPGPTRASLPGVPSSTSRASSTTPSGTKTWRGPAPRKSGLSKPGPLSMLGMPWSPSRPWIISASICFRA